MTDRYHSFTVVLDKDIREDDAEHLMNAIRCLKGVIDVSGNVSDYDMHAAYARVRSELAQKLYEALKS